MSKPNFELITELQATIRRDFPLAAPAILSPYDSRPLVEGEWLELDSNYLLARGGDNNAGTADEGLNAAVFPVHTEKGRYETQAIQKANVIFLGMYEAETLIHPADLSGYAVGDPLTVQDVTVGGLVRRGLAKAAGTDERVVVGYISKITGTGAAAKLRFVHFANQKVSAV